MQMIDVPLAVGSVAVNAIPISLDKLNRMLDLFVELRDLARKTVDINLHTHECRYAANDDDQKLDDRKQVRFEPFAERR
jgi:hypothetical protein